MSVAFQKSTAVPEYELITVYNLIATSDLAHAQTLVNNALIYQSIVDELVRTPVPQAQSDTHLALVNAVSDGTHAVSELGRSYTDPYTMLAAVNLFVESEEGVQDAYNRFVQSTTTVTHEKLFEKNTCCLSSLNRGVW